MSDAIRSLCTLRDNLDQVLKAYEKALSTTDQEQHKQAVNELDALRRKILPRPNDGSRLVDLIADPIVRVSPERYENTIRAAADVLVTLLLPWLVPGIPREDDPTTWERYEQSVRLYQTAYHVSADLKSVIRVLDDGSKEKPTGNDKLTPAEARVIELYTTAYEEISGLNPEVELQIKDIYYWLKKKGLYDKGCGTFRRTLSRARKKLAVIDGFKVPASAVPAKAAYTD
jgi:hypothetical protein